MFTQSLICIPFGGLSLQEDCHYLLYPIVGILSDVSHELHSGDARGLASSLNTDRPVDMKFND